MPVSRARASRREMRVAGRMDRKPPPGSMLSGGLTQVSRLF